MTTNNERAARTDRAARYVTTARLLSISDADAYLIADLALDLDTIDNAEPNLGLDHTAANDALLAYAQASFTSDDDYDDFRHELRVLLGPPFVDESDALWDD